MNSHYQIYTDASYDHMLKIAVCGYLVRGKGKHYDLHTLPVRSMETPNGAEWYAVIFALLNLNIKNAVISIYTDHMDIVQAIRCERNRWISKQMAKTHRDLANEILAWNLANCNVLRVSYVKAHSCQQEHEKWNCIVDDACLTRLRQLRQQYKH